MAKNRKVLLAWIFSEQACNVNRKKENDEKIYWNTNSYNRSYFLDAKYYELL